MTRVILIPAGRTDWQDQGRLTGDADLPLNELGHRQAMADAEAITGLSPRIIRCGPDQASRQTATLVADHLGLKLKTIKELREMDLGHWEGLTIEDFRERFPKVYKQWRADPTLIEPPEGETILAVVDRLEKAVGKLVTEYASDTIAVVIGRVAYAILRCRLQDGNFDQFWEYAEGEHRWHAIEVAPPPPPPSKQSKRGSKGNRPAGGEANKSS